METLGHTISLVWLHFNPTTYAEREKKPSEYCNCFCIKPTAGIEPGPPAQQGSVLSITPLPLGSYKLLRIISQ